MACTLSGNLVILSLLVNLVRCNASNTGHSLLKRSDDAVIQAAVVEQLVSKVQALEASLTAFQTSVSNIQLSLGRVNTLIAFDASFRAANVSNVRQGMTAQFDDVFMNAGNGYNPATGIFTAPVSGTYVFYIKIQTYAGLPQHLNLRDNGRDFGHAYGDDPNSWDMASTLELVHLNQGEPIWVWAGTDNEFRGSGVTRFAGLLIHAD